MPNYKRAYVPGGTFFFTVVTYLRRKLFDLEANRELLGDAFRDCRKSWPFEINAIVLLPDHLHTIWTLPENDHNFSGRWSVIKSGFTKRFLAAGGNDWRVSEGKRNEHRRGVWQRRFWEHVIEDEHDFERHFDYIHFNPVKHRLVNCPREWVASSFHRWVERGVYPSDWACSQSRVPSFVGEFGEPEDVVFGM